MASPSQLKLSVIVPVGKDDANWRMCAASLAQTNPPPDEIIIVADGILGNPWPQVAELGWRVLNTAQTVGPAHARNLGAQAAQGDILLFIDADVTVPPDLIARVSVAFAGSPEVAAVFGSYDDNPAANNFLSQYKNLFHHYVHQTSNEEASTFWSGCGAVRREIFLRLGGFAERYADPSIEDIELGYRLKEAGYRIRLQKDLRVKHLKAWGLASLLQSDFFHRALPWSEIIFRNPGFLIDDLNLRLSSRISVILAFGLLAGLISAPLSIGVMALSLVCASGLLFLNWHFYQFFREKRDLWFAIRTVPWHWLYYLYSGLAFALAGFRFFFQLPRQNATHLLSGRKNPKDKTLESDW